ncbi:hypothetical protein OROHE_025515 [Orobanche hederae]
MEQPQGHGIPIPTSSAAPTDHDLDHNEDHPDFSPVGSPELANSDIQLSSDQAQSSAHSEELRRKIIKQRSCGMWINSGEILVADINVLVSSKKTCLPQVEYYFSDENLPTDNFMLNYVTTNVEGFGTSRKKLFIGRPSAGIFPIGVIASFSKMKKLTRDKSLIVAALKESSFLVVSSNGKKVKRLHPLPLAEVKDPMVCTVLVENLPEDHSVENLRRVFGEAGNIKNITIRDPHDARDPKRCTVAEKLIIGKLHALVEYDTVEAAEKAVSTLNNEQDWRYGLRVKLLKKVKKPGQQKKKVWRESEPERGSTIQTSEQAANEDNHHTSEQHDDSHNGEVCTILAKNLPEDHSVENLRRVFGEAGNIKNITIRDLHDARDPKKCIAAEKLIIGKLHALVEYDTVEAAEKAVATLNNEQDWRYGLRVKLLKKLKNPGQQKKNVPRESEPERGSTVQTSEQAANEDKHTSEQHDGSHDDEDVDHISKEKNDVHLLKDKSGHKGRNRGRGRKQKYYSTNGHGHGTQFLGHGMEPSKPPPGPRMPDGTRGFTLGRGRPLATS